MRLLLADTTLVMPTATGTEATIDEVLTLDLVFDVISPAPSLLPHCGSSLGTPGDAAGPRRGSPAAGAVRADQGGPGGTCRRAWLTVGRDSALREAAERSRKKRFAC